MPKEAACSGPESMGIYEDLLSFLPPGAGWCPATRRLLQRSERVEQLVHPCVTPLCERSPVGLSAFVCIVFWTL